MENGLWKIKRKLLYSIMGYMLGYIFGYIWAVVKNHGPLLGALNIRCRIKMGSEKGP